MTCWRRLRDWKRAGVWERLHRELLQRLADADKIDWSRASLGLSECAGQKGGEATGPNPTDRGKPGAKRHLVVDRGGIPLAIVLSAANVHDSLLLEATLDAIPPIRQPHRGGADRVAVPEAACGQGLRLSALPRRLPQARHVPASPGAASSRVSAWVGIAGWSSGRWPGSTASAASPCAMSAAPTSIRRSSPSAARSSAGKRSTVDGFVRRSSTTVALT